MAEINITINNKLNNILIDKRRNFTSLEIIIFIKKTEIKRYVLTSTGAFAKVMPNANTQRKNSLI
ncbi:MAG: hypothetical protein M0R20_06130 [Candidatus Omnitrophica bacterium]|nr:hypothetical protein [Candidatus Omnitrophota bacterium]